MIYIATIQSYMGTVYIVAASGWALAIFINLYILGFLRSTEDQQQKAVSSQASFAYKHFDSETNC